MLTIRDHQLRVFEAEARARFDSWLLNHAHTYFPDRVARIGDDTALSARLFNAVARAEEAGLKATQNLVAYVNLVLLLGPTFASDARVPWAHQILSNPRLDEWQKVNRLKREIEQTGLSDVDASWGWP
jgi:hypothetical protein